MVVFFVCFGFSSEPPVETESASVQEIAVAVEIIAPSADTEANSAPEPPEAPKKSSPRKAKASPVKKKKYTVPTVESVDITDEPDDVIVIETHEIVEDVAVVDNVTATIQKEPEPEQPIAEAAVVHPPSSPPATVHIIEDDEPKSSVDESTLHSVAQSCNDDDQAEISIHISSPAIVELEKEVDDDVDDSSNNAASAAAAASEPQPQTEAPHEHQTITLSRSSSSSKHWRLGRARTTSTSSSASASSPATFVAQPAEAAAAPSEPDVAEAPESETAALHNAVESVAETTAADTQIDAENESDAVSIVAAEETENIDSSIDPQPQQTEQTESNDSTRTPDNESPQAQPSTDKETADKQIEDSESPAVDETIVTANESSVSPSPTPEQADIAAQAQPIASKPSKPVQRKRKWLSTKTTAAIAAAAATKPIVAITTEILKELISDVQPVSLADVHLDSSPEPEERQLFNANQANKATAAAFAGHMDEEHPDAMQHDDADVPTKVLVIAPLNNNNNNNTQTTAHDAGKVTTAAAAAPSVGGRKVMLINADANVTLPRPPSPAKFGSSQILYITNLVRPFTVQQLKTLLARTGKLCEDGFWIDKIKSKCYVKYETEE